MRIPSVVVGEDSAVIGSIVLQALSLGHVESPEKAYELIRTSFKNDTIIPYANAWDAAYDRLMALSLAE